MTSINQYSVSLSLEAGGLFTGATLARGHLQKLNRVVRELQTPVEVVEDKINFFTSALDKLGKKTDQHREIENRLYQELERKSGGDARRVEMMRQQEEELAKLIAQEKHATEITERHKSAVVKSNEAKEQAIRAAQEHARAGRISLDVLQQEIAYQYKLHDAVRKKYDPAFIAEQKKQTDALENHIRAEREALSLEEKHLSITERFAAAKANLDRIRSESLGALKDATYTKELIELEKTRDNALLAADPVHQQALKDQAAEKQRQLNMEREIIALTEKHRSANQVYADTKARLDELLATGLLKQTVYTEELMEAEGARDKRLKAEDPAHQQRLQDELDAKERQKKAEADLGRLRESLFSAEDRHMQRVAHFESLRASKVDKGLTDKEYKDLVAMSEATMKSEMVDKNAIATQEKLNSVISKHRTELQRLKADLALLMSAQKGVIGSDEQLANAISNVNAKIKEEEDRLSKLNSKTSETSGIVSSLTNRFAGFMAAKFTVSSISNLITQADQANIELSRTEAILGAISGSKFAGNQLIADLRQLTRQMPITLKDAAEGSKNLIAYGMSSREVIPVIRAIGAITGGNTERFKNLANAIAQMRGANRLMGQEVIQAVNAGWNPLAEISRNTGKSILVLKKEMEEGKLGFDLVTQALQTATTGMGRFANVAGDVMNTVAGKQQMLTARWEEGMARMGKAIEPLSIAWKEFATEAIEGIIPNLEKMLDTYGTVISKMTSAVQNPALKNKSLGSIFFGEDSALDRIGKISDFYNMLFETSITKRKDAAGIKQKIVEGVVKSEGGDNWKIGFAATGSPEEMSKNADLMEKVGRLQQDWLNRGLLANEHIQAYNMYLKRQTDEKEKQKRIADAQEKKEKQQKELSLEQMKAKEMADQKFETMMNRIKIQTEELTRGKVAADALRAEFAGLTEEQKKQYVLASRQFEIAKQKNDLEEKAAKDQIRYKDLIAKYQKKSETSAETAAREIRDIDKALAMKEISLMQAADIKQKIIAGVIKSEVGDKPAIGSAPPKALFRGSAEAVNAVLSKMREPVAIQAKQLEEQKKQKEVLLDIKKAIKEQNTIEAKR